MKQRVISAIVLIVIVLLCVFISPITRVMGFLAAGVLTIIEYSRQMKKLEVETPWWIPVLYLGVSALLVLVKAPLLSLVIAFVAFVYVTLGAGVISRKVGGKGAIATGFALIYPSVLFVCIFWVGVSDIWLETLAIACLSVWVCDSFALFGGKRFGKHKLAPEVSPNKTWEGTICGAISAVITGILVYFLARWCQNVPYLGTLYSQQYPLWKCMVVALVASSMGQLGDLAESLIKRMIGVKDFSNLIPGHGGMFDRADSLLFAIPVTYILLSVL